MGLADPPGCSVFLHRRSGWIKQYFQVVFWITVLLLITWAFLPQRMNPGFLPLVLAIALRSWMISKQKSYADKRV
jgi:hypothetical protein